MTQDEIIHLAIENTIHGLRFDEQGLLRFANLVAQYEREACAKEAEKTFYSVQAAENIRARGKA